MLASLNHPGIVHLYGFDAVTLEDGKRAHVLVMELVEGEDLAFGQGLSIPNYDVTRDGRFLMLRRAAQGGKLGLVLNWTEELKRTLAAGGAR